MAVPRVEGTKSMQSVPALDLSLTYVVRGGQAIRPHGCRGVPILQIIGLKGLENDGRVAERCLHEMSVNLVSLT